MRRWRNVCFYLGAAGVLVGAGASLAVWSAGVVLLAVSAVGHGLFHRARVRTQAGLGPRAVAVPVAGRWRAMNSPADRVPSHGVHTCAQTYAVDVVHEPEDGARRPGFGWWPLMRRPEEFPAFGVPVRASAEGVVVRVGDGQRDHLSRTSWPVLPYLFAEGLVRQALGGRFLVGNHVVVDLGDGVYALAAHLRRGSAAVAVGDRVGVGDVLGRCGNSGNSSEPHVHFQLMTGPDFRHAFGHPFAWTYRAGGETRTGVPAGGELFTASGPHGVAERTSG
ncbi:M23 family metallopeptidase [Streptomyces sp. JWR5-1]|uniref:M23 family metallopeptidase n=1 Tax=Streptomyces sp. JWR5-1 TaxID=3122053 RepID=UPI003015DBEB